MENLMEAQYIFSYSFFIGASLGPLGGDDNLMRKGYLAA